MNIGPHSLGGNLFLAPMAGVTDRPYRMLCRARGAGAAVSEMVASNPALLRSRKAQLRMDHSGEPGPRIVQVAGADPAWLADAARFNVDRGADIIDINMGCPAKKVCNQQAGSALLRDEGLVRRILERVVAAVPVPVTLKIRTGWDLSHRNGVNVARIAQDAGIRSLVVHGRTRACGFGGSAEHETTAAIKDAVRIPVIANGDIGSPEHARAVLEATGADGIMIGRAAQGNPWIFEQIAFYLRTGRLLPPPAPERIGAVLLGHLEALYAFYGEHMGVRIARKHIGWYCRASAGGGALRALANQAQSPAVQMAAVREFFTGGAAGREAA